MAYVITQACLDVKERACVSVCPVDCIYEGDESDRMLFIHPEQCINCGACEMECPHFAIYSEEDVPEKLRAFVTIQRLFFEEPAKAREELNRLYPRSSCGVL